MTGTSGAAAPGRVRRIGRVLRAVPVNTPLRIKLVMTVLLLVAVALGAAGFAGTTALRTYLYNRTDNQLAQTVGFERSEPATRTGDDNSGSPAGSDDDSARRPATDCTYLLITNTIGVPTGGYLQVPPGKDQTAPRLPTLTAATAADLAGEPFTTPATGVGSRWRVLVMTTPTGAVAVGTSLDSVDSTVNRLVGIDLLVSLVVLAAIGVLGYAVVRTSLRRLVDVEKTAAAIAGGDMTRRVPAGGSRTEVGRLASALNAMLGRIETAFSAQRASEAEARASEERMRRFVADASHELRTPLTSIRGFAELYRQGAVPDAVAIARVMGRIESEAARMGLLVEDLLLLARLDQQRPLEHRPVDLLTIAADAVEDAHALAPGRAVSLDVIPAPPGVGPPIVSGDEARLRQVVMNLLSNALTHTPAAAAVTVRVSGSPAEVTLEVIDNGPGLDEETAARAFERFYRADPSRARARGGTGLGLSIVAALVAAHNGMVEVETEPGKGATFRVRLPRA